MPLGEFWPSEPPYRSILRAPDISSGLSAGKAGLHLIAAEAAVPTERADRGDLAGLCPPGHRLGVDSEQRCNFARRQQVSAISSHLSSISGSPARALPETLR